MQSAVGGWIREAGKRDEQRLKIFLNKYAEMEVGDIKIIESPVVIVTFLPEVIFAYFFCEENLISMKLSGRKVLKIVLFLK